MHRERDERCTENKSSKLTQTNTCLHRQRERETMRIAANKCSRKCRNTIHTKKHQISSDLSIFLLPLSFSLYAKSYMMQMIEYINRKTKRNGGRSEEITEISSAYRRPYDLTS